MNKPRADMTRAVDDLGRIVIPAEIRRAARIETGDQLAIIAVPDGILLQPVKARCAFCGSSDELISVSGVTICLGCGRKIAENFKEE